MTNPLADLTVTQLKQAVEIKEQIESLTSELNSILGAPAKPETPGIAVKRGRRRMSAAGRARIAAAQKARRARETGAVGVPVNGSPVRRKRKKLSPAARARISAAAKARWAKARAAGKKRL